jgi:hypothetical protein
MPLSTAVGNSILDWIFKGTSFPAAPGAIHISLHTADPGATGASEMAGGSYARSTNAMSAMGAASSKANTNTSSVTVTAAAATATHWGAWSASSAGTFYAGGTLTAPVVCSNGQSIIFQVGDLDNAIT